MSNIVILEGMFFSGALLSFICSVHKNEGGLWFSMFLLIASGLGLGLLCFR